MTANPKIITVTANTAIDYVLTVKHLRLGDNMLAESAVKFASGKGINVAKALASLTCPVWVAGFVGSKSWALFKELNCELITTDYTLIEGETRTNLSLTDRQTQQETHIRSAGFAVTAADCQSLTSKLSANINQNDIVVLSGSLPAGAPADLYHALITICHAKSALAFLDSSGESLKLGLTAKPYLIKPNQAEFEYLVGHSLKDEPAMIIAARNMVATGVKWVIISRAEQGALLVGEHLVLVASIACDDNDIISHVGCGDALVAGFAFATLHGYPLQDTLKFAVACGAANLFSQEPGRFNLKNLTQLIAQVQIRTLSNSDANR